MISGSPENPTVPTSAVEDPRLFNAVQEYLAALEAGKLPSRREFLAQYPDLADELAACLDGLAFVHSAANAFREPNPAPTPPGSLPQTPLGDFRILQEIGRGGMGVVYEAIQLSLGRHVALKVLSFAAALDPRHLQRFKNEAQAAAHLHHRHIVPVYAVGCERGVHYYAMQLVEGQSLASLIGHLRLSNTISSASAPAHSESAVQESPPPLARDDRTTGSNTQQVRTFSTLQSHDPRAFYRTAARLMVQAAQALDYAHEMGVVHRDVKPGNLLLDRHNNIWVTDFGLAQFHSEAGLTRTGDVLGTLRYMSPEQARGRAVVLDHRTDIYSLGATLYEMITLTPVFPGNEPQELLRQIAEEDPVSPRLLINTIPPELETVVLKAMAKDPEDRYATAREMAEDLQRYLDDRPILARRPTLYQRVVKWSWRHRSLVLSAVVVLLLAAVGFLVSTLLLASKQLALEKAFASEQEQRTRAERSFRQARASVDFFAQLAAAEDRPELTPLRRKMLEQALAYYDEFLQESKDDPSLHGELEQARSQMSSILGELSALEGMGRTISLVLLLREPAVQEELHLSSQQSRRVGEFLKQLGPPPGHMRDFFRLDPGDRRRKLEDFIHYHSTALADLLNDDQTRRLQQIEWQVRGPFAFTDTQMIQQLGITEKQQRRIQAVLAGGRRGGPERFAPGHGPGRRDQLRSPVLLWQAVVEQILAILTPEQRAQWQALIGAPFTGEIRWMPPGPPPPPPLSSFPP